MQHGLHKQCIVHPKELRNSLPVQVKLNTLRYQSRNVQRDKLAPRTKYNSIEVFKKSLKRKESGRKGKMIEGREGEREGRSESGSG